MNAGTRGTMFVKADRINERVDKIADVLIKSDRAISRKNFDDFVKSVHLIVSQELTEKGATRLWKD